ncbi:Os01g0945500 [Oryza sativa Japonica Group]|uniref:Os01g0945500 protein n=1 Tax=Oryza sativa subsp. japonica TaxID=39947 RepID=A0A0P0VCQ0_ORYSJ|nr:Os01g0945500 [Oryza sativa Japonica Group]
MAEGRNNKVADGGSADDSTTSGKADTKVKRDLSHTVHGFPADEHHVREVIALTLHSRACVASLSRCLGVTLKMLVLVHRLLADGDPAFEQEREARAQKSECTYLSRDVKPAKQNTRNEKQNKR